MNLRRLFCAFILSSSSCSSCGSEESEKFIPSQLSDANVKWLRRIEVRATRLENRFMGRDYVTIREEKHDGRTEWVETSVGRAQIKSAPARVVREDRHYKIVGMAWGVPIARVEVSIDSGPWQMATIDSAHQEKYAWRLWSLDLPAPAPGEHAVTVRAIGADGSVQPAPTDPQIAGKHTYWESNGQITRHIRLS